MTTSIADEISMDGTKPHPSIEDLAVMDRIDLVSMQADASRRCSELEEEMRRATEDQRRASRRVEAVRRARKWHGYLHQLIQHALSLARDAEQTERVESLVESDQSEARKFLRAARRILSPEVCRAVWDESRKL